MVDKISGIYCIENIVNGKRYIGRSVNIRNRFSKHKSDLRKNSHRNSYLQNAWNKYDETDFKFYILCYCDDSDKLPILEMFYVNMYKTNKRKYGYNLTDGGEGTIGRKHTEEEKQRISEFMRNRPVSEKTRELLRGRKIKFSEEAIKNIREAAKNRVLSPELANKYQELKQFKKRKDVKEPTSRFLGVSKGKRGRWNVRIYINRKQVNIGSFDTEIDAALAYNDAIEKYYPNESIRNIVTEEDIIRSNKEKEEHDKMLLDKKSSKYMGVHWCDTQEKWIAKFYINKENYYIGSFLNELEAAIAYNEIASDFFGYKAKLNDISEDEIDNLWNLE